MRKWQVGMFGGKWMDTFMDKLAQKLTAQEMIKANTAAETEELNNLKNQVKEYNECLKRMQEVTRETKALNSRMDSLLSETITPQIQKLVEDGILKLDAAKVDGDQINQLVEAGIAKIQELQQDTQALEELKQQLGEKVDGANENVHKECVKVYRNVQASVLEENSKQTENILGNINQLKGRISTVLGIAIASLVFGVAGVAFQVLTWLQII